MISSYTSLKIVLQDPLLAEVKLRVLRFPQLRGSRVSSLGFRVSGSGFRV